MLPTNSLVFTFNRIKKLQQINGYGFKKFGVCKSIRPTNIVRIMYIDKKKLLLFQQGAQELLMSLCGYAKSTIISSEALKILLWLLKSTETVMTINIYMKFENKLNQYSYLNMYNEIYECSIRLCLNHKLMRE